MTAAGKNCPCSQASKNPNRPSSTVGGPVKPRRTSWAAVTPAWAARPQCRRLTVPPVRLASITPDAIDAVSPSASTTPVSSAP